MTSEGDISDTPTQASSFFHLPALQSALGKWRGFNRGDAENGKAEMGRDLQRAGAF